MGDKNPAEITEVKIKIGADEQVFCFSPGRKDEISVTVVLSDESVITVDAKGALLEKANGGRQRMSIRPVRDGAETVMEQTVTAGRDAYMEPGDMDVTQVRQSMRTGRDGYASGRRTTIVNSTGVQDGDNCQQTNIFRS